MNTKELTHAIAAQTGSNATHTETLLRVTAQVISQALCNGISVQLQNFGTLEVKERAARMIVHPKTGEKNVIQGKTVASFRPSNNIKEMFK